MIPIKGRRLLITGLGYLWPIARRDGGVGCGLNYLSLSVLF